MRDINGNLIEEKIAATKIIPLLSVIDKDTHDPIPDARLFFSYFDKKSKTYKPLSQLVYAGIENPSYTSSNGTVNVLLPSGSYRVELNAFGYDKRSVEFTLGVKEG